jgi:hypothetical protein
MKAWATIWKKNSQISYKYQGKNKGINISYIIIKTYLRVMEDAACCSYLAKEPV